MTELLGLLGADFEYGGPLFMRGWIYTPSPNYVVIERVFVDFNDFKALARRYSVVDRHRSVGPIHATLEDAQNWVRENA